ncbi:MAG: DUF5063 domain-containing protein [Opitutaceae bacterium]|nr:DUF5063 domain-containing protein [Opitutaceae bacterium]
MQPAEVRDLLKQFVGYVTKPGEKSDEHMLELCDRLVFAYRNTSYTFDNRDFPDAPRTDYGEQRAKISALFPNYGPYCLPTTMNAECSTDQMIGDAIDDLSDISRDFEEVLWRFEHTSVDDALWDFHEGYWRHWGRHMREFQFYLFHKISS